MSPMLKRLLAAVAVKKAIDLVQDRRRPPQRSRLARIGAPSIALAAAGGALAYLGKTGRLQGLVGQVRALRGGPAQPGTSSDAPAPPRAADVPVTTS